MQHVAHRRSDEIATLKTEIERLRAALKPFADVGLPMLRVGKAAVPDGASAHYLKLEPLTASHFRAAAMAFRDEQAGHDNG